MKDLEEISQQDFERIEKFIQKELSSEENDAFLNEMQKNPALSEEVERQRMLIRTVEAGALREELKSIAQKNRDIHVVSWKVWLSAAAAVVIALGMSYWFLRSDPDSGDLYAQYAKPDPGLAVPMSSDTQYDFYDAMVDYKNEQYELAIQKWQPQLLTDAKNDTLMYYIGACYFNLGKFSEAKDYYFMVRKNAGSTFYHKSGFYLALMAYKENRIAELTEMSKDLGSPYHEKIKALLDSMPK